MRQQIILALVKEVLDDDNEGEIDENDIAFGIDDSGFSAVVSIPRVRGYVDFTDRFIRADSVNTFV